LATDEEAKDGRSIFDVFDDSNDDWIEEIELEPVNVFVKDVELNGTGNGGRIVLIVALLNELFPGCEMPVDKTGNLVVPLYLVVLECEAVIVDVLVFGGDEWETMEEPLDEATV
jgi:hypothetical protein